MLKGYMQLLASANGFKGGGHWDIEQGMGFGSMDKWWSQEDTMRAEGAHNGLDIRQYTVQGQQMTLGADSVVPVAEGGKIISIIKDFLGYSIFVSHGEISETPSGGVISAYGHIVPDKVLYKGMRLKRGDTLGSIAEYEGMAAPAHLHLSIIVSKQGNDEAIFNDWQRVQAALGLKFVDPLLYIG